MTFNLKTKQVNTLCGGHISALVDHTKHQANVKFIEVKECQMCPECPFRNFCPVERTDTLTYIQVVAFTGMPIAVLPITRETKSFIEVTTKSDHIIRFDRRSGVQTNCTNSRFANRVNPKDIPALERDSK